MVDIGNMLTPILLIVLIVSVLMLYLMNIRLKQMRRELNELRDRVSFTNEELTRLSNDIDDFKKINI
jgi:cell division protein FtsL